MPNRLLPFFSQRQEASIRYVVLVDGEHYPPVVHAALRDLVAAGNEVVATVLVGGREKLPAGGVESYGEFHVTSSADPRDALDETLRRFRPDSVLDLSDEPVLDYRRRHELAAVALFRGVRYEGADFVFRPPPRARLSARPSLEVIGTGKRTGKTAVSGYTARRLAAIGRRPVVVAMGRGGPEEPEVLRGDQIELTPRGLLELADAGKHAASDYVEDALLARVTTVGCRRCGGGLAGAVGTSNVERGVEIANGIVGDILVLEGSGSALPPVHADVSVLVVPASIPDEYLAGYMGPYRMLLADFVVVTMCEYPFGTPSQISSVTSRIHDAWHPAEARRGSAGEAPVVRTVFRPTPTRSIEGAAAFVVTTAAGAAGEPIRRHLEGEHGCRVVGISHALSDRQRLLAELSVLRPGEADVLLCEVKAAGIDVATRWGLEQGLDVVYMDNVPHGIEGDSVEALVDAAARLADERFRG